MRPRPQQPADVEGSLAIESQFVYLWKRTQKGIFNEKGNVRIRTKLIGFRGIVNLTQGERKLATRQRNPAFVIALTNEPPQRRSPLPIMLMSISLLPCNR